MNIRRFFTLMIFFAMIATPLTGVMAQELTVARAVVCQEIVDRVPVGSGDVFPAGTERIFCHTEIVGAEGESEVTHNWYYKGALKASVVLPVRAGKWRTWSSKSDIRSSAIKRSATALCSFGLAKRPISAEDLPRISSRA